MMDKVKICVICLDDRQWNLQMISKAISFGTNVTVSAILLRSDDKEHIDYHRYGVSEIHVVNISDSLEQFALTGIITNLNDLLKPDLYMFPASDQGRDFAAEAAVCLKCGLVADCIDINYENEFIFVRTTNSDSVLAEIVCCNGSSAMCTVKKNIFEILPQQIETDTARIHYSSCDNRNFLQGRQILRQYRNTDINEASLSEARIIFGIGRGCSDKIKIDKLRKLAGYIGAEIAGTRAVVDDGIINYDRQVGQSGVRIAPDIYIAFGISGAAQHVVGIDKTKTIIAVNRDKEAPIFRFADYAVIADCEEVIDSLINEVERGGI